MNTSHPLKTYYNQYLHSHLKFLVPQNAHVLKVSESSDFSKEYNYDYLVVSDVLGHIDDIQDFLINSRKSLKYDGRIVVTQYNILWEPLLKLSSWLGFRKVTTEKNWLSMLDLKNFLYLSGYEVVKSGSKMLIPRYIPCISYLCNTYIANTYPFSKLGMYHYLVARIQPAYQEKKENPSVSIIVPARNEAGTIQRIINELPDFQGGTEIIFVEGHSRDNTYDIIKKKTELYKGPKKIFYTQQDGKGKGDAVRKGFDMAHNDILMIYDADMTVPASDIEKFYLTISSHQADFVNGSRLVYPLEKQSMKILNFFGNKFFSYLFSVLIGQPIKDTLCGTKVIWKKDYQTLKIQRSFFGDFDPFGDFDLLFGASKLNLKIIDLPVHYKERVYGDTNIHRWKHGWLLLRMVVFAARKIKFI